jgi:hypothetical protein
MFPKDRTVYANLNTSFTDFDELLLDLRGKRVTGYVVVSFKGYDGVLFVEAGETIAALEQLADTRSTGENASANVIAHAHEKGGAINVYTLAPEVLRLLVRVIDAEALYRDLTSSFTSLERLIAKLEEDRLNGYIVVTLNDARGGAVIFFESGRVVECVFSAENQNATGPEVVSTVIHATGSIGASFNVYRAPLPAAPVSAAPAAVALEGEPGEEPAAPVDPLTVWSEIIGAVESVVDGLSKTGRFATTFKEVLVGRAGTYPFLDPFAAEFEYRAGKVSFEGPVPADFNKGLGDCLSDAIARLAFQLKRADLETRIRARLTDFGERYSDVIEKFQLSDDIQEFVA